MTDKKLTISEQLDTIRKELAEQKKPPVAEAPPVIDPVSKIDPDEEAKKELATLTKELEDLKVAKKKQEEDLAKLVKIGEEQRKAVSTAPAVPPKVYRYGLNPDKIKDEQSKKE